MAAKVFIVGAKKTMNFLEFYLFSIFMCLKSFSKLPNKFFRFNFFLRLLVFVSIETASASDVPTWKVIASWKCPIRQFFSPAKNGKRCINKFLCLVGIKKVKMIHKTFSDLCSFPNKFPNLLFLSFRNFCIDMSCLSRH